MNPLLTVKGSSPLKAFENVMLLVTMLLYLRRGFANSTAEIAGSIAKQKLAACMSMSANS